MLQSALSLGRCLKLLWRKRHLAPYTTESSHPCASCAVCRGPVRFIACSFILRAIGYEYSTISKSTPLSQSESESSLSSSSLLSVDVESSSSQSESESFSM